MKGIRASVLVVSLTLLSGAGARATEQDPQYLCKSFADVVYAIAKRRDNGETVYEVRNLILRTFDESIREPSLRLADFVFKRPWSPANKEADDFLKQCLAGIKAKPAKHIM